MPRHEDEKKKNVVKRLRPAGGHLISKIIFGRVQPARVYTGVIMKIVFVFVRNIHKMELSRCFFYPLSGVFFFFF